jgi:puromycin-sensitive aminopeptidase
MPRASAANPYRLDRTVVPEFYSVALTPDLEKFTFSGIETLTLKASKPFSKVTLHALEIDITKAMLDGIVSKKITYDKKYETATLHFDRKFPVGVRSLVLNFSGSLNDKMHGFYRTSYEVAGKKCWGAATQFEATDARRAFPCWDEPDLKARFRVTLTVPKELTALSNMPEEEEIISGDMKRVSYAVTPIMPTYLLCFVVADLEYVETKDKNGVPIRVYTTPGKKEQGRFALEVAAHTLPYFGEWFGIPYALPKCDQVALPDFASGAMENWGLITYRETALLVDPKNSSAAARQRVAEVIDHELAHQWFGNLVTMEWWTDLWLNEGFASYMGPKAVDHQFPEWDVWTQFLADDYFVALRDDSLKNSHPIEIPVKNPHEIREIFDHITYSKGSSVNRMLEHYLSETTFRKGLRAYLKKYAYGNAKTVDLWTELEKASGKPVKAVMASYTKQEGYPALSVKLEGAKQDTLAITQERFVFDGSKDSKKRLWKVPVTVRARGGKDVSAFLSGRTVRARVASKKDAWIKVNPGQSGFYRTAYAPELLERLVQGIQAGDLPVIDCLGIVDDAFYLARAGRIHTSGALAVAESCRDTVDYNVWLVISGILGQIENILDGRASIAFERFARRLFAPVAGKLGWEASSSDPHLTLLLRGLVMARRGHFGDPATIDEAKKRFEKFVSGGSLDPNLRSAVYGIIAEHGGSAEYDKLLRLYCETKLQEEKVRVLRALTRFRDAGVIAKVLQFSLSPDVRSQDTYVVLAGFGSNRAARDRAWKFVKDSWKTISARFGGGNVGLLAHILEGSTESFTTREALTDVERFFKSHPVPGTERATRQAVEIIRANLRWLARDAKGVAEWLEKR